MTEFIVSDGDYRGEKFLENGDHPKPLFEHQRSLSKLPVAPLHSTCEKYLASVHALVDDIQYRRTVEVVSRFLIPGGAGEKLYSMLLKRQKQCNDDGTSWLAEWWNKLMYLQVRDPVVINVSYFFHFIDSPVPEDFTQVGRAASLVHASMVFHKFWATGTLPPERIGKDKVPLCSVAYKYMFNACRVPAHGQDSLRLYSPHKNHHIAVVCRGIFYTVEVKDDRGNLLSRQQIEKQLANVVSRAMKSTFIPPTVGVLSSQNRDDWAEARAQLVKDGNEDSLQEIESAAFVLCLDQESPVARDEVARALWHGDGENRWYDKPIQLIVFANGKAGMMNEHSMMDGMPVLRFADYLLNQTIRSKLTKTEESHPMFVSEPSSIDFSISPTARRHIAKAEMAFDALTTGHDLKSLAYAGYGSDVIKTFKMSPDAYVQMAFQLAYFRMTNTFRATYEPVQMRRYLHGRTACVRTVSDDSVKWVKAMTTGSRMPTPEKLALLKAATVTHVNLATEAGLGHDIDRLMLGLNLLATSDEDREIFRDPSFPESKHWALSTSHLTHEFFDNWGWGEVVPDGIGIAYMIKSKGIYVNLAAVRDESRQWPMRFCHLAHEALEEMRVLCEAVTVTSKI